MNKPNMTPADRSKALAAAFDAAVARAVAAIGELQVIGLRKLADENPEDAAAVANALRAGWLLRSTFTQAATTRTAWLRADVMDPAGSEQRLWMLELARDQEVRK